MTDSRETMLAQVDAILGREGSAVSQGYRFNPQQLDYANRAVMILSGYDEPGARTAIGMLEAATGLGKTLGYLTALMVYAANTNERVAIATHSRQLQRQMLEKDAPHVVEWVAELTGVRLSLARRVGRQNYLSRSKIQMVLSAAKQEGTDGRNSPIPGFLTDLLSWLDEGAGVLDDYLQAKNVELPSGLAPAHITLDSDSDTQDALQYQTDIAASRQADVLVINHALLVLHAYRWGSVLDSQDEPRRVRGIVVDEAHKLPAVAETVMSDSLSVMRFSQQAQSMADDLGQSRKGEWRSLADQLEALNDFLASNALTGSRYVAARQITGLPEQVGAIAETAEKAARKLARLMQTQGLVDAPDLDTRARGLIDSCNDLIRIASVVTQQADGTALVSWSPVRRYPSLSIGSPDAGRVMSRLWAPIEEEKPIEADALDFSVLPPRPCLNSIVFTSATLGIPGEPLPQAFDSFSRQLGIIRHASKITGKPVHNVKVQLMVRHEPSDFGTMYFVLADPRVPLPTQKIMDQRLDTRFRTSPEWLAYSASMVTAAHRRDGDRVLALTLSWRDTQALAEELANVSPPLPLVVHEPGQPLRACLEAYRETPGAILLTPSGWEGIDLPGMVPNVVVHRLPHPPPERDEQARLRLHLRERGYSVDRVDSIVRKRDQEHVRQVLAQGMGRGIRSATDTCTVWIADPRFPQPASWLGSFDPILSKVAGKTKGSRDLLDSIPERFRDTTFERAAIYLRDSGCYDPEVF